MKGASRKSKKGENYFKWEVILSKEAVEKAVEKAGFKENNLHFLNKSDNMLKCKLF